jgi:PAS domain S-box-containing protein
MTTADQAALDFSELQQLWELSFQSTTRGIAITDPDTTTLRAVNPAFARMHGGVPSDFVGQPPSCMFTAETARRLPEWIDEVERTGFISFESEHVRLDGSTFPVANEGMSIVGDDGKEIYKIGWFTDLSERHSAERRSRESQRQFEAAFAQAAVGMALVGLDGRWLRANRTFCEMTGYEEVDLLALTFTAITHPDDLEANLEGDRKLLSGELSEYRLEKRYIHNDGSAIWVLIVVSLVRDDGGEPIHYLVHAHDISLRKRVEEEFTREARGSQLDRELMCTSAPDGRIERLEGPWEEVLGDREEAIRARGLIESVHPDDREATAAELRQLGAAAGEWRAFRNRWLTGDGGWRWLSWSAFGLGEERIFWSVREVDDRVAVERASELRGRVIDEIIEGVCLVTTEDMRIVYANPSLERMMGYGDGELDGVDAIEVMRPANLTAEEMGVRSAAAAILREQGSASFEGRHQRRDGSELWCHTTTTTFDHPRYGSVWVAIMRDVTEERRARETSAELEAAKTEFLSSVSHELRTPLTSILGYAALLREDAGDEETRKHLDVIERNASRQLRLVEDLLSIARIQAGEFEVLELPVDLAEVVGLAVAAAQPAALDAGLELVADLEGPAPLRGDSDRLGQVLANLISNAIKFTPRGGRIDVSLRRGEEEALLRVADTGPGVRSSERTQLFERLFRGSDVREAQISGAGLGLAITRSIVEAHKGRIAVGDGEGGGAVFEVALPLAATSEPLPTR